MNTTATYIDGSATADTPIESSDVNMGLLNACRCTRPVVEDAISYIMHVARLFQEARQSEVCREARIVLVGNLSEAIVRIDSAIDDFIGAS